MSAHSPNVPRAWAGRRLRSITRLLQGLGCLRGGTDLPAVPARMLRGLDARSRGASGPGGREGPEGRWGGGRRGGLRGQDPLSHPSPPAPRPRRPRTLGSQERPGLPASLQEGRGYQMAPPSRGPPLLGPSSPDPSPRDPPPPPHLAPRRQHPARCLPRPWLSRLLPHQQPGASASALPAR